MASLRRLHEADARHGPELVLVLAGDALRPRIDLGELLGEDEAGEIGRPLVEIVQDLAADLVDPDALLRTLMPPIERESSRKPAGPRLSIPSTTPFQRLPRKSNARASEASPATH